MTFDKWRSDYDSLSFAEQVAYHNELELLYPHQAHYNAGAAKHAIAVAKPKAVIEAGLWKADLAREVLAENDQIESWRGIEICTNAVEKTACHDPRFGYLDLAAFDWWKSIDLTCDLFIATHFCEHLSNEHFMGLVGSLRSKFVYFEIPLSQDGQGWVGYHGTHKLGFGWVRVMEVMRSFGYNGDGVAANCVLFSKEGDR